ncbi:Ig-like domain repeat protein [Budviciaceae bacterium BWR-B9]|uniref:Ig-like domain repeat protein n=1 Tax=Limnobaculum allomyrinae TaxID=2791986 RepID=A0ABS1IPN5_9GAMM|nr:MULTISPECIES: Ig-like domain-containing protein [Limnobaculum]MBK5143698.1 Ig-like domain repeat protein [Limnobaculum allomyrinae]MBV7692714.1 Ig-like domain repeat protein [Limnobaculum sp. M2-1]
MNHNVSLLVNSGSSTSQVMSVDAGRPIKIKIQPGCKYLLKNKTDNYAPENVTLQRNGDDLYVILEGDSTPAIVIQDYYVSGNNEPILGMAEDGQLYAYMVTNGSALGEGYQFENGTLASAALGGMPLGNGAYLFNDTDHDHDLLALWPWFLGVAALGALAAVVFHKDDDSSSPAPAPLPASVPVLSGAMDATGSITGPIAYGSSTDEQKPLIYGTGDAGNTITIYDNGKAIGIAIVGADGTWSFKPATALSEGDHSITITQTNASGSISASSDDFSFIIDITAPQRPLFNDIIDDVGTIQGPITNGAVIDDARPEITGSGEPGNTITVFVDGKEIGTTIIDNQGNWSFTPASDLTDDHHQITVTETDKAGNTSPVSPTFDFTVDTIAPAIPTIESAIDDVGTIQGRLSNGGAADDSTPTLLGKAEINSIVKVYDGSELLGSAVANGITGEWVFTPAKPISEGEHHFHVTATDKAGNTSQPSLDFVLTTDYTPPDRSKLAITGVEDQEGATTGNVINNGMTDDARPIISGTGTAGDTIVVYVKDATGNHEIGKTLVDADGKWSLQPATPLLPGNNQFTAIESDPVGNATTPSDPYSVNLDIVKPVEPVIVNIVDKVGPITGVLQKGAITDDNQPTIIGTARVGYIVHVYDGASLLGTTITDSKGVWRLMPEKALADGKHNIMATATSPEGEVSEHTGVFNFEVDTKVPTAPEGLIITDNTGQEQGPLNDGDTTDNNTPAISGNTEPGNTVVIYDNGEKIGEATADTEGNWIFVPDVPLADGEHEITVTVRDEAGNTNTDGPEISIIIDTSKVLVSITTLIDDVGTITGSIKPHGTTDDVRPEIIGQGKVGNLIKVYDDKTLIGTTTVKADGT